MRGAMCDSSFIGTKNAETQGVTTPFMKPRLFFMNTLTKCRAITLVRPNEQRATLTLFPLMPLVQHQRVSEIGLSKVMQSELYDFGHKIS